PRTSHLPRISPETSCTVSPERRPCKTSEFLFAARFSDSGSFGSKRQSFIESFVLPVGLASSWNLTACVMERSIRAGPAAGSARLPGLGDVLVTHFRAQQKNPIEHGHKTVGYRAKHKEM